MSYTITNLQTGTNRIRDAVNNITGGGGNVVGHIIVMLMCASDASGVGKEVSEVGTRLVACAAAQHWYLVRLSTSYLILFSSALNYSFFS